MLSRSRRMLNPFRFLTLLGCASILLGAGGVYLHVWPFDKGGLWPFIVGAVLLGSAQFERRRWKACLCCLAAALLLFAIESLGPGLRPLMNGHLKASPALISLVVWGAILIAVVIGVKTIFLGSKSDK